MFKFKNLFKTRIGAACSSSLLILLFSSLTKCSSEQSNLNYCVADQKYHIQCVSYSDSLSNIFMASNKTEVVSELQTKQILTTFKTCCSNKKSYRFFSQK